MSNFNNQEKDQSKPSSNVTTKLETLRNQVMEHSYPSPAFPKLRPPLRAPPPLPLGTARVIASTSQPASLPPLSPPRRSVRTYPLAKPPSRAAPTLPPMYSRQPVPQLETPIPITKRHFSLSDYLAFDSMFSKNLAKDLDCISADSVTLDDRTVVAFCSDSTGFKCAYLENSSREIARLTKLNQHVADNIGDKLILVYQPNENVVPKRIKIDLERILSFLKTKSPLCIECNQVQHFPVCDFCKMIFYSDE